MILVALRSSIGKNIKIPVITVSFYSQRTRSDTISLLNSPDYQDIQYIIVDGVSTDTKLKMVINIGAG